MWSPLSSLLIALALLLAPVRAVALDIALVGDSHMEGLAPYLRSALTSQGHTVHVVARRGWSCRSYRRSGSLLRRRIQGADLVIVSLGGNDRSRVTRSSSYLDELEWILQQVGSADVVWLGPPVSRHPAVDERHRLASHGQAMLLPLTVEWVNSRVDTEDLLHAPDGVHFRFYSYRIWAERVLERIKAHL